MNIPVAGALAVAFTVLAVALLEAPAPERRLGEEPRAARRRRRPRALMLARGVVSVGIVGGLTLGWSASLLVDSGVLAVAVVTSVVLSRRDARVAARRRGDVARACRVLAAQLRIGQVPAAALRSAALDCPPLERAAATQAVGGDVSAALREAARDVGYEGLRDLAMAWTLAERTGAPIAHLASRVSAALRTLEANRAAVSAELAAPRASGRILAALPALGLMLGALTGGDPLRFLLATLAGRCVVLGGVLLAGAGVLWTELLADRAAR